MENNSPSFIVNGKCKKKEEEICNIGYACDACPYNKKLKHKHEWEEFRYHKTDKKPFAIKCKICKKISFLPKPPQIHVRHGKIHYETKGAFGSPNN